MLIVHRSNLDSPAYSLSTHWALFQTIYISNLGACHSKRHLHFPSLNTLHPSIYLCPKYKASTYMQ